MSLPAPGDLDGLECRLDRLLRDQVSDPRFVHCLRSALQEWSQAIWAVAENMGASDLSSDEIERGLQLARRPVFVCGPARSGTTLLRDLLDGHPELAVIPSESAFYAGLEPELMRVRPDRYCSHLARRWLERLADPPPFWLLGGPPAGRSAHVAFARDFAGWWRVPERHADARIPSWPLAAFALAYAQRLGGGRLPLGARMWVEKTPGTERNLARIWRDFPAAKIVQIVRRPADILASIKTLAAPRWDRRRTLAHVLGQMAPSFAIAAQSDGRLPDDRYCLVRYEELVATPDAVMSRVARFLGIAPAASLSRPTVAGRPGFNNSSFGPPRPDSHAVLDPFDRALLAVALGRSGAKLGYPRNQAPAGPSRPIVGGMPA